MLRQLQVAVDAAAFAASRGQIATLRLETPPSGKGDVAICIGPLAKALREPPHVAAKSLAESVAALSYVAAVSIEGPFLNLCFDIDTLVRAASDAIAHPNVRAENPQRIMVEYLSPNTNKPLHLGHLRNGVLGSTLSNLLSAVGHTVVRAELINDRGEHICKSMLGYLRHGSGMTPGSSGKKGDHFVGDMYVAYMNDDKDRRKAIQVEATAEIERSMAGDGELLRILQVWNSSHDDKEKKEAFKDLLRLVPNKEERPRQLLEEIRAPDPDVVDLLGRWETGDPKVLDLWQRMNGWVYDGFAVTKPRFGFFFDKVYYESELYKLGKDKVQEGLERGVFFQDEAGAVLFDLPVELHGTNQDGKPHRRKVLNANGTSNYITQDIGTAILKANDFEIDSSIYVTMDEQNPHFKALFAILRAMRYNWADRCHHMSYAEVKLPKGRMKSREGTTVDGDNLADEMAALAADIIRGREPGLDPAEVARRAEVIGITAIKFYLARFSPTSVIKFDPEKSLAFEGDTGPYVLYTYARTQSLLAKGKGAGIEVDMAQVFTRLGNDDERACLLEILHFPEGVQKAAEKYAPSILTDRMFSLAAAFNRFYKNHQVISEDEHLSRERLALVKATAEALRWGFSFFGIEPLEKM